MTVQDILAKILEARGLSGATRRQSFLNPDFAKDLHDPYLLNDMNIAVDRIVLAKEKDQKIGIFGDYDIDGITATTVLTDAFGSFGIDCIQHIPNRFIEGYGMSREGVDLLKEAGAELIITVDCGSTSEEEIVYAKSLGIDVIVTDHHEVPEKHPPAFALINPKRKDSEYPFSQLAGVGVAFKLVQALQQKIDGLDEGQEKWLLDLVAFGTVCDIVSLTGENRALVYWGLKVISKGKRLGFRALAKHTEIELDQINSMTFGFKFGPRLNAAGRLDTAMHSLDLMLSDDWDDALRIAETLEAYNHERRALQSKIFKEAIVLGEEESASRVTVVAGEGWAEGVVGIVASKLVEYFEKPAFVLSILEDGDAKGSARSFGDFSVVDAIRANDVLLEKGGGHAYAGGVTLPADNIDKFRKGLDEFYKSLNLVDQKDYLLPKPDVELDSLESIGLELIDMLAAMEPFGQDNKEPMLKFKELEIIEARPVGAEKNHLKVTVSDGQNRIGGIGFSLKNLKFSPGDKVDIVASLAKNEFRGITSPQLLVKSISLAA